MKSIVALMIVTVGTSLGGALLITWWLQPAAPGWAANDHYLPPQGARVPVEHHYTADADTNQ